MVSNEVSASSKDESIGPLSIGTHKLTVLSKQVLELLDVSGNPKESNPPWNFVETNGMLNLPSPNQMIVVQQGITNEVTEIGYKRRVSYAPLSKDDLRVSNYLYLNLSKPLKGNLLVEVGSSTNLFPGNNGFTNRVDELAFNPAIHVNQMGYMPSGPKEAMIGYFLGSMGEMDVLKATTKTRNTFTIIESSTGKEFFHGQLSMRPERGFKFETYQQVMEADFSELQRAGQYWLVVPGLGRSYPFSIHEGVMSNFTRTYALGIYQQRCGCAITLPFTRFTHAPCHTAPASLPMDSLTNTWRSISKATATANHEQTAPTLTNSTAQLFPILLDKVVDVSGGHHDAGDYGKYTTQSASFISFLLFAVDSFPGVKELDNLGIPESGNAKCDLLDEVKWEADFLVKMQDEDGGFFFLVHPKDRDYESNVLPDKGDPQVVWPKNTAATAAAVAALAQCSSSPTFQKQFPREAQLYREKANEGWNFLEHAFQKYGKDGSYQKLTHYGDEFMHHDELAWAACEMYLATKEPRYHQMLLDSFNPDDPKTFRWGWWRMYGCYGNAIRSYAFSVKSGRLNRDEVDLNFMRQCENQIATCADEQVSRSQDSSYGISFPNESKRVRAAGWFFTMDQAFDVAVGLQLLDQTNLDKRHEYLKCIYSNLNYQAGCNPNNISFITGLGWNRPIEIVHQYAQNDRRVLPPSGLPIGNVQAGFGWINRYKKLLGELSFPLDGAAQPFPLFDRWGDSFNLSTEFVISNQARALATLSFLMAQTSYQHQSWKPTTASILQKDNIYTLQIPDEFHDVPAITVWESSNAKPIISEHYTSKETLDWIEAESVLMDGRRFVGVKEK